MNENEWRAEIKQYFSKQSESRHETTLSLISIFNRFSEENLQIEKIINHAENEQDEILQQIVKLYEWYKHRLQTMNMVDFALLQQRAYSQLLESEHVINEFEHVVIDEFQDTNRIQEQLFFVFLKGIRISVLSGTMIRHCIGFVGLQWRTLSNFQKGLNFTC